MTRIAYSLFLILTTLCIPQILNADWEVNMTQGVTAIGQEIYGLHMIIFYICVAIAVVVFGIMFYSMIYHRKSLGATAKPFHESTVVELIWTAIPLVILIAMAIPATKTLSAMYDNSASDIDIKVTGYQWKWRYEYLNQDLSFFSSLSTSQQAMQNEVEKSEHYLLEVDKPLVIPINKKVRFLFTANDVIHSWWVPELAVKKDAIPGFINESWTRVEKPGIYRGQCTELCGQGHGYMPVVVHALSEEDYELWLADQKRQQQAQQQDQVLSHTELMAQGEQLYVKNCAACHQTNGQGIPPVFPALKNSPLILGAINDHIEVIIKGRPGTAMSAFGEQLSATEIAAIVTYERNAWGNDSGDTVQSSDVSQFKNSLAD